MKRGEVWTVSGGLDYAGKPRPAVIVQDQGFELLGSITVCGMTTFLVESQIVRGVELRPTILPSKSNGLNLPSQLMIDKITTVPSSKLGVLLGRLDDSDTAAMDRALLIFFGLAESVT